MRDILAKGCDVIREICLDTSSKTEKGVDLNTDALPTGEFRRDGRRSSTTKRVEYDTSTRSLEGGHCILDKRGRE